MSLASLLYKPTRRRALSQADLIYPHLYPEGGMARNASLLDSIRQEGDT